LTQASPVADKALRQRPGSKGMGIVFDQVNLVAHNLDETLTFYRRLGLDIPEQAIWRTPSGAHHVTLTTGGEVALDADSRALARRYNAGFAAERGRVVLGFLLESREAVDALYAEMIGHEHQGLQVPYDAFWGARYAIVEDPDGNPVGLQSPVDPALRSEPPKL
jgi:catechol 2,3-dioxygenase-like lactoylglutathione lyase family enzyme